MTPSSQHWLGRGACPFLAIVVLYSGCATPAATDDASDQGPGVTVRHEPLVQHFYPLPEPVCTDQELRHLASLVDPRFPKYPSPHIPVALIYHAMRVWGPDCPFATPAHGAQGTSQEALFLRILTQNAEFKNWSKVAADHLLTLSDVGVHVVTNGDSLWGAEQTSTHFGKYVLLMAELGIPTDHPLAVVPGQSNVLADVIVDHAWNVHLADENDWAAPGLARYLTVSRWHNRFGQSVSFDDLVSSLTARPLGEGACFGTHMPYALAALLDAHQEAPILSEAAVSAAQRKLTDCKETLTRTQLSDGSWAMDWYDMKTASSHESMIVGSLQADRVIATGHQLEWMITCPPRFRPDDLVLMRAALYLKRTLPLMEVALEEDYFHWYMPISHAVRGLLLAHGHRWADPSCLQTPAPGLKPGS